ncbi:MULTISPECIES: hypothetical protein [Parabacteroides]|jgi:hypothetical protein|uniref:hypothetical protein n=1 Tax=Parabacteroides TaxID=375288 RepID=UPI001CCC90E7|nr:MULTISPECIES: hypothetical protein [Parabacteroides]UBD81830.1 hypothetical protein K6V20_10520 [Parabacteroides distasonis]
MKAFAMGKDYLCNSGDVCVVDHDINELDAYIKIKEMQSDRSSFEEGMSLDEIAEIASNRMIDLIREQLDMHVKSKCLSI